jgi:16S rRNA (guanine1207-N2)-methyltransferase
VLAEVLMVSHWRDRDCFRAYMRSDEHRVSHGRIDAGSRLLAEALPDNIAGSVADFGAGWGYLASEVARRATRLDTLDLYEADFESCEAARRNLSGLTGTVEPRIFWRDVTAEALESRYDLVVMNPPFHATGRGADPAIGIAMIRAAAGGLRAGGRLFMVANVALPYERVLAPAFAGFEELCRRDGFKVLLARR